MAEKKSWFGIEMLVAVLLIAAAMAVVALVPMVECPTCHGQERFFYVTDEKPLYITCPRCSARKKVTLMNKWFRDVPAPSRSGR